MTRVHTHASVLMHVSFPGASLQPETNPAKRAGGVPNFRTDRRQEISGSLGARCDRVAGFPVSGPRSRDRAPGSPHVSGITRSRPRAWEAAMPCYPRFRVLCGRFSVAGFFPMFVRLAGRIVVVVGGGELAVRTVEALLKCDAEVRVISPTLSPAFVRLRRASNLTLINRRLQHGDLEDALLALAVDEDAAVNLQTARQG